MISLLLGRCRGAPGFAPGLPYEYECDNLRYRCCIIIGEFPVRIRSLVPPYLYPLTCTPSLVTPLLVPLLEHATTPLPDMLLSGVTEAYNFNDNARMNLNTAIKNALEEKSICAPEKNGI